MLHVIKNILNELQENGILASTTEVRQKEFPYVTMKINTIDRMEHKEVYRVEMNVWDKDTDIIVIETLSTKIREVLDGLNILCKEEMYFIQCIYGGQINLDEIDTGILRREITFIIHELNGRGLTKNGKKL